MRSISFDLSHLDPIELMTLVKVLGHQDGHREGLVCASVSNGLSKRRRCVLQSVDRVDTQKKAKRY